MAEQAPTTQPNAVIYQERLWPAAWIWIVVLGISVAGIFVFAPINLTAGYIAAVVLAAIMTVLLILSTPRIVVTNSELQVGRATIGRRFVGAVDAFEGEAATEQRGTKLDATAYLCIRGWISPVVRIEITDEADRTPYWLTSTRRPRELAAALGESRA